jgi:tRNA(Ile)-lysidine synthetase-like protein
MPSIPQYVTQQLTACRLFSPETLLVVAVSGGPDSLCLLHALVGTQQYGGPRLHVAHLDHSFRGEESAAEAAFVAETAAAWGIPATVETADVSHIAHTQRLNKQTAARRVRYHFLARVAAETGAHAVAVAHHADDQAETVLLHLLRGAGLAGLRGMRLLVGWEEWGSQQQPPHPPAEGSSIAAGSMPYLVRPLLGISRASIEDYCQQHGLTPRFDSSNASHTYTRNRLRDDLLPLMQQYNPHIVAALGRTAQLCADDYAWIQQQLASVWNDDLVQVTEEWVRFVTAAFVALPTTLQRYALRHAIQQLNPDHEPLFDQIELGRAACGQPTGTLHPLGGGLILRVEYDTVIIFASTNDTQRDATVFVRGGDSIPQLTSDSPLTLPIPGDIVIPTSDTPPQWTLSASTIAPETLPAAQDGWRWWVVLDADKVGRELCLRKRQPGDRFRPAGGRGSRLVQDFLVDRKVPRGLRNHLPILTTPAGEIVWVVGLRADARFVAGDETSHRVWVVVCCYWVGKM